MNRTYVYIVSSGSWSDYEIEYFAVHQERFSDEALKAIMEEVKQNYIQKGYPTEDYKVDHSLLETEFLAVLHKKGFSIVYPSGEFRLLSYSKMDDLSAEVPWDSRDREASELRIGTA